jgi:hypothetical protein
MKEKTALIKILDGELCSDEGMGDYAYTAAYEALSEDAEIMEILEDVEATDGRFYFPKWHPGIENTLRVDCGSRNDFLSERFEKFN